jgi:uncharacterized membrane protein
MHLEPQRHPAPPPNYLLYWIGISLLTVVFVLALLLWFPQFSAPGNPNFPTFLLFLGRFHPMIVHLPIGVLTVGLLVEIGSMRAVFEEKYRDAAVFLSFIAACSSVVAVIFGIYLSREGGYGGGNFILHQMLCLIAAFGAVISTFVRLAWATTLKEHLLQATRFCVFATFGLLSLGSHFGGNMVHGSTYLTEFAPSFIATPMIAMEKWMLSFFPSKDKFAATPDVTTEPAPTSGDKLVFQQVIRPLLEAKCNKCHHDGKEKGGLRMDTYELAMKGGDSGDNIVATKPDDSLLIIRMKLPADDDDHMPPEGKEQPTKEEIELLTWWVQSGASATQKLSEAQIPPALKATVDSYLEKQ